MGKETIPRRTIVIAGLLSLGGTVLALRKWGSDLVGTNQNELSPDDLELIHEQFERLETMQQRSETFSHLLRNIEDVTELTLTPGSGFVVPAVIDVNAPDLIVRGRTQQERLYFGLAEENIYRYKNGYHAMVIDKRLVGTDVGDLVTVHELKHLRDKLPGGIEYAIPYEEMDPYTSWLVEVNAYELEFNVMYELFPGSSEIIGRIAEETIRGEHKDESGRSYDPYTGYNVLALTRDRTIAIAHEIGFTTEGDHEIGVLGGILGKAITFRAIDYIYSETSGFNRPNGSGGYQISSYYFPTADSYKVVLLQLDKATD
ncbi:MAG TPA: hypothetical protein ENI23_09880 [bacterium]|nr:hypothetical protein [bacterium]